MGIERNFRLHFLVVRSFFPKFPSSDKMTVRLIKEPFFESGMTIYHAGTVPDLADLVKNDPNLVNHPLLFELVEQFAPYWRECCRRNGAGTSPKSSSTCKCTKRLHSSRMKNSPTTSTPCLRSREFLSRRPGSRFSPTVRNAARCP